MKNTRFANFCAERIDVITKFAVITNVVVKRVYCNGVFFSLGMMTSARNLFVVVSILITIIPGGSSVTEVYPLSAILVT